MTAPRVSSARAPHPVLKTWGALLLLSLASLAIHGYHVGFDDQAVWLPAIKHALDPTLYPRSSEFFLAQTKYSLFPDLIAELTRWSGLSVETVILVCHFVSIFVVLSACRLLAVRVFTSESGRWGAVAAIAGARLMIASGSRLSIMDRYLHPRDLVTGAVLIAFSLLFTRRLRAFGVVAASAVIHPTMAVIGSFHLAVQAWRFEKKALFCVAPPVLAILFNPVRNPAWQRVVESRGFLLPLRWHGYEWLGVVVPLAMLGWFAHLARAHGKTALAHLATRVAIAGVIGLIGALAITTIPVLEGWIPTEPMRTLQLVYFFWIFIGGGLLAELVLGNDVRRWMLWMAPLALTFFAVNAVGYPATERIELPGARSRNQWIQAFTWVRVHTPKDAFFALNPFYMDLPGNDGHGFRAFAERGAMADGLKDRAVTANAPELAEEWANQMRALDGWQDFRRPDFAALRRIWLVDWVIVERRSRLTPDPKEDGLDCPYENTAVFVCRIR
jgi:hypothetical protein